MANNNQNIIIIINIFFIIIRIVLAKIKKNIKFGKNR